MRAWDKWAVWKKCIFVIIALIVLIRIGYIVIHGELNKQYVVENEIDTTNAETIVCTDVSQTFSMSHDNLNKLEILLFGIADDKKGAITIQILRSDELVYQTNISLANVNNGEWKQFHVNLPIEIGQDYILKMNATPECTSIPTVLTVNGNLVVRYGYLAEPDRMDKAVNSSLWILFLICVFLFLNSFEKIETFIKNTRNRLYQYMPADVFNVIVEVFLCMAIIGSSGIAFQNSTMVLLYIISIICTYKLGDRHKAVSDIFKKPCHRVWLYILYIFCAFSLVGQRLLIYPINLTITIAKLFVFMIAVFWSIPVVDSFIWVVESGWKAALNEKTKLSEDRKSLYGFVVLIIALLIVPAAYNLFANNPGISSADTCDSIISSAKHLHGMVDWHPAFYCMVLRAIITVWDSTYAVILVQYFFWAYVMVEFLLYLRSKGLKNGVVLGIAAFCGLNAGNFIHLNTIWKDIPYALSLLWTLIILSKLIIDEEKYKKKWYIYLELVIALIGVFFYRKNGVVSSVIITFFMAIVLWKNKKIWVTLGVIIALICCIKGPIYDYFEVKDTGRRGMYIGLSQDILGAYYYGGDLSEETIKMINVITQYNNAEYPYTPTWSYQSYDLDVEPSLFIRCYIDTFLRNPVIMGRAIIAREDAVWDIFAGQDSILGCVNFTGTMDENAAWAKNYPKRIYRSISDQMSIETAYTASNQWIAAIEWRCGLFTLLGFISIIVLFVKRGLKKSVLFAAPIIGHMLSLLLSTGWSDFRYFWPLNLMNMCIILYAIVLLKDEEVRE